VIYRVQIRIPISPHASYLRVAQVEPFHRAVLHVQTPGAVQLPEFKQFGEQTARKIQSYIVIIVKQISLACVGLK
jgi:hypothetical protein